MVFTSPDFFLITPIDTDGVVLIEITIIIMTISINDFRGKITSKIIYIYGGCPSDTAYIFHRTSTKFNDVIGNSQ